MKLTEAAQTLGLSPNESDEKKIKQRFRELSLKYHPDKNLDNVQEATVKFRKVSEAMEVMMRRAETDSDVESNFFSDDDSKESVYSTKEEFEVAFDEEAFVEMLYHHFGGDFLEQMYASGAFTQVRGTKMPRPESAESYTRFAHDKDAQRQQQYEDRRRSRLQKEKEAAEKRRDWWQQGGRRQSQAEAEAKADRAAQDLLDEEYNKDKAKADRTEGQRRAEAKKAKRAKKKAQKKERKREREALKSKSIEKEEEAAAKTQDKQAEKDAKRHAFFTKQLEEAEAHERKRAQEMAEAAARLKREEAERRWKAAIDEAAAETKRAEDEKLRIAEEEAIRKAIAESLEEEKKRKKVQALQEAERARENILKFEHQRQALILRERERVAGLEKKRLEKQKLVDARRRSQEAAHRAQQEAEAQRQRKAQALEAERRAQEAEAQRQRKAQALEAERRAQEAEAQRQRKAQELEAEQKARAEEQARIAELARVTRMEEERMKVERTSVLNTSAEQVRAAQLTQIEEVRRDRAKAVAKKQFADLPPNYVELAHFLADIGYFEFIHAFIHADISYDDLDLFAPSDFAEVKIGIADAEKILRAKRDRDSTSASGHIKTALVSPETTKNDEAKPGIFSKAAVKSKEKKKNIVCQYFKKKGYCYRGDNCWYMHPAHLESRTTTLQESQ